MLSRKSDESKEVRKIIRGKRHFYISNYEAIKLDNSFNANNTIIIEIHTYSPFCILLTWTPLGISRYGFRIIYKGFIYHNMELYDTKEMALEIAVASCENKKCWEVNYED